MAAEVTEDDIREAFEGIKMPQEEEYNMINECLELCRAYELTADTLAIKWDALKYRIKAQSGRNLQFNMQGLAELRKILEEERLKNQAARIKKEKDRLSQGGSVSARVTQRAPSRVPSYTQDTLPELEDMLSFSGSTQEDSSASPAFRRTMSATSELLDAFSPKLSPAATPGFGSVSKRRAAEALSGSASRSLLEAAEFSSPGPASRRRSTMSQASQLTPPPSASKYASRTNSGEVLLTWGDVAPAVAWQDEKEAAQSSPRVQLEVISGWRADRAVFLSSEAFLRPSNGEAELPFRFMYEDDDDKRDTLDSHVAGLLESIAMSEGFRAAMAGQDGEEAGELAPTTTPSQEPIAIGGRVVSADSARLSAGNIELEGDRAISAGKRIRLNVSLAEHYSLFPGQVLVARGTNVSGSSFAVQRIFTPSPLPHRAMPLGDVRALNAGMRALPMAIMVAAGPFTTTDNLDYAPLIDLLLEAKRLRPDVLILCGPFLDVEHPVIKTGNCEPFEDLFLKFYTDIVRETAQLTSTHILIVPSLKDAHHMNVFPQPPFASPELQQFKPVLLPNPCTVRLNDIVIGIANNDICPDIIAAEAFKPAPGVSMPQRIATHLLEQRSYYPLLPHGPGANVDTTHWDKIQMPCTPDILILPSRRLKHFAQGIPSADVVVVNPGPLARGESGAAWALISVHPLTDDELLPGESPDKLIAEHHILKRTRVDIKRI